MQYRELGKTGIKVSALGFGAMRLPEYEKDGKWYIDEESALKAFDRAVELGVNYFDTAFGYCHENSQYTVGKALKGRRGQIYLSTKIPVWRVGDTGDYRKLLEEQLRRLDTDYIDFYHFHALGKNRWDDKVIKYNLLDEAVRAKEEGLIRHISFSFHDKPEFMKEMIDTGVFSSLLCQYNLLDRSHEDMIAYAKEKGVGVVIMGPVAGGRLAFPSEVFSQKMGQSIKSTPELALKFVLSNPDISCALSGMSSVSMVEENAAVASLETPLTKGDYAKLEDMLKETKALAELYCTGCEYCMPCPKSINIARVFALMNYHKVYGLTDYAKTQYTKIGVGENTGALPSECISCGVCETKCPQNIQIRKQLKEVVSTLAH